MGKKKHKNRSESKKAKAKRRVQMELSKGKDNELLDWAKRASVDSALPESVKGFLGQLSEVLESGAQSKDGLDNIRMQLAIAMRITPSSERSSDLPPLGTDELDKRIEELDRKVREARRISIYSGRKATALEKERDALRKERDERRSSSQNDTEDANSEDPADVPEDEKEGVFSATPVICGPSSAPLPPSVSEENQKGLIMSKIERRRDDVLFLKSSITFTGQEFFNPKTGEKHVYDFGEIGPPGSNLTFRACVVLALQVAGMGMPIARVEKMLGGGSFSRQNIHRTLGYIAHHLVPIYVQLIDELSEAKVIAVDDTYTRVNEISHYFRRGSSDEPPWKKFEPHKEEEKKSDAPKEEEEEKYDPQESQKEAPTEDEKVTKPRQRSVAAALAEELQYAFSKARDSDKMKTQHLTSCAHAIPESSPTRIVIYRSHLGSAGNLLDQILARRSSQNKSVTIVGDLSTSNRVRDPKVLNAMKVDHSGCASHARRPFFRHLPDDPDACIDIIDCFKYIFEVESIIKRDKPDEKVYYRNHKSGSARVWEELRNQCEALAQKYSAATPLGEAARYVIRNYDALTLYLKRGELPADNNLTERLLRFEKLAERNTYGSKKIEGRARMDVLRSVITTTRYSKLDESLYLLKVLSVPREEIVSAPEKYTPHAIKKQFEEHPKEREHFVALLNARDYRPFVKVKSNLDAPPASNP